MTTREVLRTIDVTLMPRFVPRVESYPVLADEPPPTLDVEVFFDGRYGYEIRFTGFLRNRFGGADWRDRETAIAFCEQAAWDAVHKYYGRPALWVPRTEAA